jgi:hypothetical protein
LGRSMIENSPVLIFSHGKMLTHSRMKLSTGNTPHIM